MVKGIIFDMDGVLVDTESFYQRRREDFLCQMEFDYHGNRNFVGSNERAIWETMVPEDPEFRQEMLMGYRAYRRLHPIPYGELLDPQVPGLFRRLKEDGLKLGIASSSYLGAVREVVKLADAQELVDFMISGEDCAAHKPNPEIYLRSLDALGLAPEEAIAVEDSPAGIAAAKGAGLRVYALRPKGEFELDQSAADGVLEQLTDVLAFL